MDRTNLRFIVISYGVKPVYNGIVPDCYSYKRVILDPLCDSSQSGFIPIGFSSFVKLGTSCLFFQTRKGIAGPEYTVLFPDESTVLVDWADDVDSMWICALLKMENASLAAILESDLELLDTDPLHLFGVTDPHTQSCTRGTDGAQVNFLRCADKLPSLNDWFAYLKLDSEIDRKYSWIVESFRDSNLPQNWSSMRATGGYIVFTDSCSGEQTSQHPFYDYFGHLLRYCRTANTDAQLTIRINRLLWSYEATSVSCLQPLVSPSIVLAFARIFDIDLSFDSSLLRQLKQYLLRFSIQYHEAGGILVEDVGAFVKEIEEGRTTVARYSDEHPSILDNSGEIYCVDCPQISSVFCVECRDSFCLPCCHRMHSKGNRAHHKLKQYILCSLCNVRQSMYQCSYFFTFFCGYCYTTEHSKILPKFLELAPIIVDYSRLDNSVENNTHSRIFPLVERQVSARQNRQLHLGLRWHSFRDAKGILFFYNYATQESMRRSTNLAEQLDFSISEESLFCSLASSQSLRTLR